jgi:hypothetical protein
MKSALSSKPSHSSTIAKQSHSEFTTPPDLYLRDSRNLAFYNGTSRRIFTGFPTNNFIFISGLILLFFWPTVSPMISDAIQRREMDTQGVITQALMTDSRIEAGDGEGGSTIIARYTFSIPETETGQSVEYSFDRDVSYTAFTTSEDSQASLTYLPSNPTIFRFDGDEYPANSTTHILIGMVEVVLFLSVAIMSIRSYRRNHLLFVRGRLLHGKIVYAEKSIHEHTDSDGCTTYNYTLELLYRFQNPRRNTQQPAFTKEITQKEYRANTLPKVGTSVAVLYMNDQLYELL